MRRRSPRPGAGRRRAPRRARETRSPSIVAQSRRATRVSPAVSTRTTSAPAAAIAAAVSSKRRPSRGCWSRSSSKTADRPGPVAGPLVPAADARCGRPRAARTKKAGSFAFSLTCVFQRRATGRGQVGAVDDGEGAPRARRRSPRRGAEVVERCSEEGGRGLDLGLDPRGGAGQRGDLGGDRPTCRRRRRVGWQESRAGRSPARRPSRAGSTSAPPVPATILRAPSAPAAAKQASVSSVSPE